ncbi:ribosome maturation factor RimP [Inquilinus sp. Marseille-Q2685]|uniref:ribosome maturation factor RimP n=1 Tax=Inquilinus sp. Marseille-Q2685 TaxID=2866581 RepID=UPI001CE4002D|nr:ribosome maturation factor RimP [Inquilinus sp. Marseille-Q2685]
MTQVDQVRAIVAPSLEAMGYEVVRVLMTGGEHRPQLQIMAERIDRRGMTVDDCAEISRAVSAILDVEDPIPTAYTLEVSSPGIDRPLTRPADYERFLGHEARLETRVPVDGRKRFRGVLAGIEGETVLLRSEEIGEEPVRLPFAEIQRAKLILTDALIEAAAAEVEQAEAAAAAAAPQPDTPQADAQDA